MNTRPTTCQTTRAYAIPLAILFAFIATAPTLIAQFSLGGLGGAMSIGSGLQGMGMSGMGNAMARRFAGEGMKIVLVDVEADALADAARALEAAAARLRTARLMQILELGGRHACAEDSRARSGQL